MADSLLDVILCVPSATKTHGMLVGSREALHSLEHVLQTVGGPNSTFLGILRRRMAESDLPISPFRWLDIPILESSQGDQEQKPSDTCLSGRTTLAPEDFARADDSYYIDIYC